MRLIARCFVVFILCLSAEAEIVGSKLVYKGSLDAQNAFLGVIRFKETSKIASQSSGVAEKVLFSLGDRVKKGEDLVVLSSDLLQKDLQSKMARLEQAELLRQYQQRELERHKNLLESDSIALQQYEKLSYEFEVQELAIFSLKAEVERIQVELKNKTIKAPFDGVIVDKSINVGEWIKAGDGVCEILNHSQPEAIVDVPSGILPFNQIGDAVSVSVNQKIYTGKITAMIPRANPRSRTFPVLIRLPDDVEFFDGMSANAMLKSGGKSEGWVVPRDSVIIYRNRQSVFIIRDDKAVAVGVEVLAISGDIAIVRGNLKEKERVIYKGQYRLVDGSKVIEEKTSKAKKTSRA